jgi:hypothetical protein
VVFPAKVCYDVTGFSKEFNGRCEMKATWVDAPPRGLVGYLAP